MFALGLGLQYILGKYIVFKLFCKKVSCFRARSQENYATFLFLGIPNLDIGNSQHSTTIFAEELMKRAIVKSGVI